MDKGLKLDDIRKLAILKIGIEIDGHIFVNKMARDEGNDPQEILKHLLSLF